MPEPILSIAMIFKNEARCLERCLKSLAALRERIPCQLVMADTGSTDGSREIAAQYADVLFDFPWIDDFSAARNATLERCAGQWVLVIDSDEWIQADELTELEQFLQSRESTRCCGALVVQRNYSTADLTNYDDALAYRMMRMSARPRYVGTIHELPEFPGGAGTRAALRQTILHHDGYIMLNDGSEAGKEKLERNIRLLRGELEASPNDLSRLMQLLESGRSEPDYPELLRRAVLLTERKTPSWETFGPAILRIAVRSAYLDGIPGLEDWAETARRMFPDSYFTRIEIAFYLLMWHWDHQRYEEAAAIGELYRKARRDFASDKKGWDETGVSVIDRNDDVNERDACALMARAYAALGRVEPALEALRGWNWPDTDGRQVRNFFVALRDIAALDKAAVTPLINACWDGIRAPIPSASRAEERIAAFRESCEVPEESPPPSPELIALAERVRAILSKLPPDDPIAKELKSSSAYQKVAHLIEQ